MSDVLATLLAAAITAVTALVGWLARRAVTFVDRKIGILDAVRAETIQNRIVDTVTLVARATMQTYVDEMKAKSADGKLTKEEAAEAFRRTLATSSTLLWREGIEVSRDVLEVVIEAVVSRLKLEKNAPRG